MYLTRVLEIISNPAFHSISYFKNPKISKRSFTINLKISLKLRNPIPHLNTHQASNLKECLVILLKEERLTLHRFR